jgi:hypothetical protein
MEKFSQLKLEATYTMEIAEYFNFRREEYLLLVLNVSVRQLRIFLLESLLYR